MTKGVQKSSENNEKKTKAAYLYLKSLNSFITQESLIATGAQQVIFRDRGGFLE